MSAGWVAGSVRAAAMARRRLGPAAVRSMAASPSLAEALGVLDGSPYGSRLHTEATLAGAQHAVAATLLWNLRVLAGWLPATGAEMLRILAGWFEIANVDEHLRTLVGQPAEPPFRLGTLTTAWPRIAGAASLAEVRTVLARSAWGDPGEESPRGIGLGMRLSWAARVDAAVAAARPWAGGAAALLAARETFATGRRLPDSAAATVRRLLGTGWSGAATIGELAARVGPAARWAVGGVTDPVDLWRAEARWWARLRTDGAAALARSGFGPHRALGAVALLAVDAWQVRAGLELAARGGQQASEVLDAVA